MISFHWAPPFTWKGRVRLNEMRSQDRLPSHIMDGLEIVCQIVFMVRQVHAVDLELPAWNYIGNGRRGSWRTIQGQLRLRGREEKKTKSERMLKGIRIFLITDLKHQGKGVHRQSLHQHVDKANSEMQWNTRLVIFTAIDSATIC